MTATLYVELPLELKELIGQAADAEGVPIYLLAARLLAKGMKRPDLALPRKKMGRPRKRFALSR